MGFFWSQPTSYIEPSLHTSLLDEEPELIFRSGDLLLVASDDLQIMMNEEPWSHVAIVVVQKNEVYAFTNGHYEPIGEYIYRHSRVFCRPLHCIRHSNFDKDVLDASKRARSMLLEKTNISIDEREGFCIGKTLAILGLVDLFGLSQGPVRPMHFSCDTVFKRLELVHYNREQWLIR